MLIMLTILTLMWLIFTECHTLLALCHTIQRLEKKSCANSNKDNDNNNYDNKTRINNIIFILCKFFIKVFTGGLSLKSAWKQVSLGLQDPPKYQSWS